MACTVRSSLLMRMWPPVVTLSEIFVYVNIDVDCLLFAAPCPHPPRVDHRQSQIGVCPYGGAIQQHYHVSATASPPPPPADGENMRGNQTHRQVWGRYRCLWCSGLKLACGCVGNTACRQQDRVVSVLANIQRHWEERTLQLAWISLTVWHDVTRLTPASSLLICSVVTGLEWVLNRWIDRLTDRQGER